MDTLQFSEEQVFVGTAQHHESLTPFSLCPAMREKKTWKWQVDYYGLALSMLALIRGSVEEPCIIRDAQSGLHTVSLSR